MGGTCAIEKHVQIPSQVTIQQALLRGGSVSLCHVKLELSVYGTIPLSVPEGSGFERKQPGSILLLKDTWWVMISWVLVPEFQESKVHKRDTKMKEQSFFSKGIVVSLLHLAVFGYGTEIRSQTGASNLFTLTLSMNLSTIYSENIY